MIAITGVDELFRQLEGILFDLALPPTKTTLFVGVGVFVPVGICPPPSFESFDPFSSFKSWNRLFFNLSIAFLYFSRSISCRLYASIKDAVGVIARTLPFSFSLSSALRGSPPHSRSHGWRSHMGGKGPRQRLGHLRWARCARTQSTDDRTPRRRASA